MVIGHFVRRLALAPIGLSLCAYIEAGDHGAGRASTK